MSELCPQCDNVLRIGNKYCNRRCFNLDNGRDADTPIFTGIIGEEKIQ